MLTFPADGRALLALLVLAAPATTEARMTIRFRRAASRDTSSSIKVRSGSGHGTSLESLSTCNPRTVCTQHHVAHGLELEFDIFFSNSSSRPWWPCQKRHWCW